MAATLTSISKKVTTNEKERGYTTKITAHHTFSTKGRKFKVIYRTDNSSSGKTQSVDIWTEEGWKPLITLEDVVCDIKDSSDVPGLTRNYKNFEVAAVQYINKFF